MLVSSLSVFRQHMIPAIVVLAAGLSWSSSLSADPLDKPACERLQSEKQTLIVLGVDKEFARGPEWAKANLAQSELNLLKRYIDIEEQLKFRCGLAVVTLQIPDEPEDGPDDDSAPAGNDAVPMPERRDAALAKPAPKPAVAPVNTQPAAAKPGATPAAPVKPAPKPAPKSQSSWSTQTAPVESAAPSTVEQIDTTPKQDRRRRIETGG
jgi:hypothetical protein